MFGPVNQVPYTRMAAYSDHAVAAVSPNFSRAMTRSERSCRNIKRDSKEQHRRQSHKVAWPIFWANEDRRIRRC